MRVLKRILSALLGLAILGGTVFVAYWLLGRLGGYIRSLDVELGGDVIAVSGAIIVAAITVVLGQYLKSRAEIRAALRERKIEVYEKFIDKLFDQFYGAGEYRKSKPDMQEGGEDLVIFLQEWQKSLILRGSNKVLSDFINWQARLVGLNAETIYSTDKLIKSIRKDVGLPNYFLPKGFFSHFILQHSDLFLARAKANPKLTLSELAKIEEEFKSGKK